MTTVVISQPMYFPWPGFFELIAAADVYVHLDDVQFSKGGFTNRIQLKTAQGSAWMSIPLVGKGAFQEIRRLAPSDDDFGRRHRDQLRQALKGAPHVAKALEDFDLAVAAPTLADILTASIERPAARLGLHASRRWLRSSELDRPGRSSQRVLDIVRAVGGTRYVTAHGAAGYLDHALFEAAGVQVDYVDYSLTPYPQLHGDFTPYVSVLDLIANTGDAAPNYIQARTKHWRDFLAERAGREAV